jgi:non-homologous end joining protein Ku
LEFIMEARAYWKGYLKLSLVSCPIALFPATSERDKISFHQLNKKPFGQSKLQPSSRCTTVCSASAHL